MPSKTRVVVIGGGMAGISSAARLAEDFDVTVLEQELQPGYHSTGRSAAVFHKAFENDIVHRLTCWSEPFFKEPEEGFEHAGEPMCHMLVGTHSDREAIGEFLAKWTGRCPWLYPMNETEIREHIPALDQSIQVGVMDEQSLKLDVHSLLTGFRKRLTACGGKILTQIRVESIGWNADRWCIAGANGTELEAEILVNAAGAWADSVARLAGVPTQGIQPKRRTALLVDAGVDISHWPMCYRAGLYFKPDAGFLLVSPADETDTEACDAQPELLDVATTIERLNATVTLEIERPEQMWAGLRSFAPDRLPVIGFEREHEGFFWVAGLGGYGIQTSPAYSEIVKHLVQKQPLPDEMGIEEDLIAPSRQMESN